MKKIKSQTRLIAHRGFSSREVENTLPAFLLACREEGFAGVECDVQVTKDGKFVIFHDRDLKRMCGVDIKVSDLTLSELQYYPLFNNSGILDYRYHIPSIEEYLEVCKTHNKICVIELKSRMNFSQVKQLLDFVKKYEYLHNCIFISFHLYCLVFLRLLSKEAELQHICDYTVKKKGWILRRFRIGIDYKHTIIKPTEIALFKKYGLSTNSWTVNDPQIATKLMSYDIDFITTNYLIK